MNIHLLFRVGGEDRTPETIEIADNARLKHVLIYLKMRGDWNGTDLLKVWVNEEPKYEPMKDKEQVLQPNDLVRVELPNAWIVD